jgi:RNA polymerase sigma-70 factor (ECF subfamily)
VAVSTDSELVDRLRNGDIAAGGELYERYKRSVFYFIIKIVRHNETAQDLVQHTFIAMLEKIGTLHHDVTFRQWLFTIARNEAFMELRRSNIRQTEELDRAEETIFEEETPHTIYAKLETADMVRSAVDRLTPGYREVILLRLTEQLSYEEIAGITNSSVSAVRSKLHKARIALATELVPYMKKEV